VIYYLNHASRLRPNLYWHFFPLSFNVSAFGEFCECWSLVASVRWEEFPHPLGSAVWSSCPTPWSLSHSPKWMWNWGAIFAHIRSSHGIPFSIAHLTFHEEPIVDEMLCCLKLTPFICKSMSSIYFHVATACIYVLLWDLFFTLYSFIYVFFCISKLCMILF
jgi:hypothetical protein